MTRARKVRQPREKAVQPAGEEPGVFRVDGKRGVFVTDDFLLTLSLSLRTLMGSSSAALYGWGIESGKRLVENLRETGGAMASADPEGAVRASLDYLTRSGWGHLEIREIDPANHTVRVESMNLIGVERLAYAENRKPHPSDDFTRGLIAGVASAAFRVEFDAIETICRANGGEICAFLAAPRDVLSKLTAR